MIRHVIYILTLDLIDDSPKFRKEEFVPYSKFDNIYGKYADKIKKRFDFFVSKEGIQWYKKRNLTISHVPITSRYS